MKQKLALPHCDKCGHKWHARYRRSKPPKFYCPKCSRVHPRWTAAELAQARTEGAALAAKWREPEAA